MIVNGKPVSERMLALLRGRPMAFVTTMRPDGRMSTNPTALPFDGERYPFDGLGDERVFITVIPERISSPRMPVEEGSRYREPQPKA